MNSFESIPGRVFLDTCAVNFILDFGEEIFENATPREDLSYDEIQDILSLHMIFATGQRATWQLAISPFTYREVVKTRDATRRSYLENWFFEVWAYWLEILRSDKSLPTLPEAENIRIDALSSGALDALKDLDDRVLVCDALVYKCDAFCTLDFRTILKYRDALVGFPIEIITPSEWWVKIKPWAAIWC